MTNFLRTHIKQQLTQDGFVLIDAGLLEATKTLAQIIEKEFAIARNHFSYSLLELGYEKSLLLRQQIKLTLHDFYGANFIEYKTLNESFLVKPKNTDEEMLLHQDFCYTDEAVYPSYNIWIPLSDVDEHNGAIFVLPGSHNWFQNYRSSSLPTSRISMQNFPAGRIKKVKMQRGQVLLFHPALFHGSFPNNTDEDRVVITATVTDGNANFLYYHQEQNSDTVEVYRLDEDAYLRDLKTISIKARPNAPLIENQHYKHQIITEAALIAEANKML